MAILAIIGTFMNKKTLPETDSAELTRLAYRYNMF